MRVAIAAAALLLILSSASLGQSCPGGICPAPGLFGRGLRRAQSSALTPAPASVPAPAPAPSVVPNYREWLDATLPDGRVVKLRGWKATDPSGKTVIGFFESENPEIFNTPAPAPAPAAPRSSASSTSAVAPVRNYGVTLDSIHDQPAGTIVTRDHEFERELESALGRRVKHVAPESLPKSTTGPVKAEAALIGREVDLPLHSAASAEPVTPWAGIVGAVFLVAAFAIVRFSHTSKSEE